MQWTTAHRLAACLTTCQWICLLVAALSLPAVVYFAYQDATETSRELRIQLIQRYSLWETDPGYRGTPQSWTRFAAWLLDTDQLLERVRATHGEIAEQVEQDFRRDMVLAAGRVVAGYLAAWLLPLAALYGAGLLYRRRR